MPTPRQSPGGGPPPENPREPGQPLFKALGPNESNPQVRAECVQLYQVAQQAYDYGPIPDGKAQAYWSGALAHLESFANECVNSIDGTSYSSAYIAGTDIRNMNVQEALFASRMKEILETGEPTRVPATRVQRGIVAAGGRHLDNVLVVPNSGVILYGGNDYVNVTGPDGQPVRQQFTPGMVGDETTEVLGGLSEGQEVLLPYPISGGK